MDKAKANDSARTVSTAFRDLQLAANSLNSKSSHNSSSFRSLQSQMWNGNKGKTPPSLLNLSLGVLGSNLEEIIDDLPEIAVTFPPEIKMVLMAIARRRKLLNDVVVIALADSSWEMLDISGSEVSDSGLCHVVTTCEKLKAVDISRCRRLTPVGVSKLLQFSHSLEILRWGGWPSSDFTARRCLSLLKPVLNDVEGDSWEELDAVQLNHGAQSLRWLVWPNIDKDSQQTLTLECPRIVVNPKTSLLGFRGNDVPREAVLLSVLDDPVVKDIDPKTWAVAGLSNTSRSALLPVAAPNELPMAEKFRLAFLERDTRLAPKRAKNARQHERRAQREWLRLDTRAKSVVLASKATKSVNLRNL